MISEEVFSFPFPTGNARFSSSGELAGGYYTERHRRGLVDFVQITSE
jgi:hypothetical protein